MIFNRIGASCAITYFAVFGSNFAQVINVRIDYQILYQKINIFLILQSNNIMDALCAI